MNWVSVRRSKRDMVADLGFKPSYAKLIAHSTLEYTDNNGDRVIRFHLTDIIRWSADGSITLNSGGTYSATTKKRFNDHLTGCDVWQRNYQWYLTCEDGTFDYYDGISVTKDGYLTNDSLFRMMKEGQINFQRFLAIITERFAVEGFNTFEMLVKAIKANVVPRDQLMSFSPELQVAIDGALGAAKGI